MTCIYPVINQLCRSTRLSSPPPFANLFDVEKSIESFKKVRNVNRNVLEISIANYIMGFVSGCEV